jgi:hypothetical protein
MIPSQELVNGHLWTARLKLNHIPKLELISHKRNRVARMTPEAAQAHRGRFDMGVESA